MRGRVAAVAVRLALCGRRARVPVRERRAAPRGHPQGRQPDVGSGVDAAHAGHGAERQETNQARGDGVARKVGPAHDLTAARGLCEAAEHSAIGGGVEVH